LNRLKLPLAVVTCLSGLSLLAICLVPAVAQDGVQLRKITASLHDGHSFSPLIRGDGEWLAYGVRESVKGTFQTKFYARSLEEGGVFRSVWPKQHPSLKKGEGTASFTDILAFDWSKDGDHNAMVAVHKRLGQEVFLETMNVRLGGAGDQNSPAVSPDGTQLVSVSEPGDGSGTDLWVVNTVDGAEPLQLTFTRESELAPAWHPSQQKIIHEQRNPLGSDLYVFDLDSFTHTPLLRLGTSDEILPTYGPDGVHVAFLSNKDSKDGLRWDLFVFEPGKSLPRSVIKGVRRSDRSRGYCWDPLGRYLIAAVEDELAGYPLVIAPADGSERPLPFSATRDNMDPSMVAMGDRVRLAWVALDERAPPSRNYRIVWLAEFGLADYGKAAGLGASR
jgi:hypothetical protein